MRCRKGLAATFAAASLATLAACSASPTNSAHSSEKSSPVGTGTISNPSTFSPSTSSTAAQSASACPPGSLEIGRGSRLSPATGEHGLILTVISVAPPCTITGFASVTLLDATGVAIRFTYVMGQGPYVTHQHPQPVPLGGGKLAYFLIAKYRCDTGFTTSATGINLLLPGQGTIASVPTSWFSGGVSSLDFCTGGRHPDPGNTVAISPFEPAMNLLGA
jgi:hypothetical protein